MSEPSITLPLWVEYFRALGLSILGALAAFVAFLQYRLAIAKRKDELFDRRYQAMTDTVEIIDSTVAVAAGGSDLSKEDLLTRARYVSSKLILLFDENFAEKIHDVMTDADCLGETDIDTYQRNRYYRIRRLFAERMK